MVHADGDLWVQLARIGEVCAEVTGATGAAVMLMSDDMPSGSVGATDEVSSLLEDLHFALGEGPCVDAVREDRPVFEPDLANPEVPRWTAFSSLALKAGARAVFGFPMRVRSVRVGALSLYSDQPRSLTGDQHADAMVVAEVAAEALLVMQANAPDGQLAHEIQHGGSFQHVVHQASGMMAAQLEVGIAEAQVRLRAHAFADGRPMAEVAGDVVARRIRFGIDGSLEPQAVVPESS